MNNDTAKKALTKDPSANIKLQEYFLKVLTKKYGTTINYIYIDNGDSEFKRYNSYALIIQKTIDYIIKHKL